MFAIEFEARIRNGVIEIPDAQRQVLLAQLHNDTVRVIVLATGQEAIPGTTATKDLLQDAKERGYDSFIQYLLDHPIDAPGFQPLRREEIYERARR